MTRRIADWLTRWGPILPLLFAELIVWVGFGALLPVMPLYFEANGVDLQQMGYVIAAWPAARLIGEPVFGYVADRAPRVPLMVGGLVGTAIAVALSLVFVNPTAFLVLRGLTGLATSVYDPAARGFITDSTPPERRGEAFGLYGAAQMAGLLLGPAIGGIGAELFGGIGFVFAFCALATAVAAVAVALRVRESAQIGRGHVQLRTDVAEFPAESPDTYRRGHAAEAVTPAHAPTTLLNRLLVAAVIVNVAGFFAGGTYDVLWSLFMKARGASEGLIGLTFAMFALPVLLVSPFAGRWVDRRGVFGFVLVGALAPAIASFLYPFVPDPVWVIPILFLEATGFAILNPALFTIVSTASPPGRSSTAQGVFGAAGTIGFIVASIVTGYLADIDLRYPFWLCTVVMPTFLVIALLVGGRQIRRLQPGAVNAVPT